MARKRKPAEEKLELLKQICTYIIWFQESPSFNGGLGSTSNIVCFDYGVDQVTVNMNSLSSLEKAVRKFHEWERLESNG